MALPEKSGNIILAIPGFCCSIQNMIDHKMEELVDDPIKRSGA